MKFNISSTQTALLTSKQFETILSKNNDYQQSLIMDYCLMEGSIRDTALALLIADIY